jgi:hypothetical protein
MEDLTTEELYTILVSSVGVRGIRLEGRDKEFLLDILYNSQYTDFTDTDRLKEDVKRDTRVIDVKECSICYEEVSTSLDCTHSVCEECLNKLTDDRCPQCRRELQGKLITPTVLTGIYERMKRRREEQEMTDLLSALTSI